MSIKAYVLIVTLTRQDQDRFSPRLRSLKGSPEHPKVILGRVTSSSSFLNVESLQSPAVLGGRIRPIPGIQGRDLSLVDVPE